MTEEYQVLSALIDGEAVDPDAVADALERPANRALLVDFIRLRQSVQRDDDAGAARRRDGAGAMGAPPSNRGRIWLRVAAVFTLLTAGALGGTWLQNVLTRERPPEPTRIVQLELVESR